MPFPWLGKKVLPIIGSQNKWHVYTKRNSFKLLSYLPDISIRTKIDLEQKTI
jgi:hypothetical protein